MRKLLFVFSLTLLSAICFLPSVYAYSSPGTASGFVNDFANMLSTATRTELEDQLETLNQEKKIQIAIVTINSLEGDTIENFAEKLFQEWGIGYTKVDSGLLLLIAKEDRKARIEVGYGLEGTVPDATADLILRKQLTPAFKEGKYDEGVKNTTQTIIKQLAGEDFSQTSEEAGDSTMMWLFIGGVVVLVGIVLFAAKKGASHPTQRSSTSTDESTSHTSSSSDDNSSSSDSGSSDMGGGESGGGGASADW